MEKPKIIAEIGCNHMGKPDIALELIELAKDCGADVAKFQKRNVKLLLSEKQYNAPHPNPWNAYGESYGKHREALELTLEQHKVLKNHCEKIGITYATSVWDVISAREIISLQPVLIKVPSACNNNIELLKVLRDEYTGDVHISLGMTTKNEEKDMVEFFETTGQAKKRLIIYACTSGYPVPFKDISLLEISRIKNAYQERVKNIGFSGHHLGIAIDIAAYTLGANWIERHFTKDRTWKGTDHAASLEVPGFQKMVRNLHQTHEAMTYKPTELLEIEKPQREKLKFKK